MFAPYVLQERLMEMQTMPFTMAFSNTPGLLKPLDLGEGRKSHMMQPYIVSAGKCGLSVSILSYVNYLNICVQADEAVMKDPRHLAELIEKNLKILTDEFSFTEEELNYSTSADPVRSAGAKK